MKMLMVDPPSGWVYGFPKRMPADTRDVGQWLIDNGYPSEKVVFALSHLRMWASRQNEDEDEGN